MSMHDGIFPRIRRRLLGERDAVDVQLADIARQGASMARLAHTCAFVLIVLFSLGSLVALSGSALVEVASYGMQPRSIPAAISIAVSTLLVTCMDVALIYAAAMLRILNARRADGREKRLHVAVLLVASLLEAGTYVYMAAEYDQPATLAAWALVAARALAAPLFGVYLSMARALPVGPRDILYQVELASGKGVIRDAVTVANDSTAPLSRKMALYGASAVMTEADRGRLHAMIAVVQTAPDAPADTSPVVVTAVVTAAPDEPPSRPPTGPGSPIAAPGVRTPLAKRPAVLRIARPTDGRKAAAQADGRGTYPSRVRTPLTRTATVEAKVRRAWRVGMTVSQLQRAAGISRSAAGKYRRILSAEATRQAVQ